MRRRNPNLTEDFRTDSYWWSTTARPEFSDNVPPASVDVAVIGGGVSGLAAAHAARARGASVCVLDGGAIGDQAASRNLGFVVTRSEGAFSAPFDAVIGGLPAHEWVDESLQASAQLMTLIETLGTDCDTRKSGRIVLATTRKALDAMRAQVSRYHERYIEWPEYTLTRDQLSDEIGGRAMVEYVGAKIDPAGTMINPAKLVKSLAQACHSRSVSIHPHTLVTRLEQQGCFKWKLSTSKGTLYARNVIVAAMGSVNPALWESYRRTFPFLAHVIATEEMPPELMRSILPKLRGCVDTRQMFYNFRPTPDGRRLLFACDYLKEGSAESRALHIRAQLVRLFPMLRGIRISHCWNGSLALTRDHLPHLLSNNGAIWCIGGNIAMAIRLGLSAASLATGADARDIRLLRAKTQTFPPIPRNPRMFRIPLRIFLKALDKLKIEAPK